MSRAAEIADLAAEIGAGALRGDAHYWDLRRTYGDTLPEVLRYLRSCVTHQREHDTWVDHVRNREITP